MIGFVSSLVPALGAVAHADCGGAAEHGLIAMAIPLAYNLRNLVVRKTTTLMTALGIALTVAVLLAILALVNGLRTTLASSGDPLQIIVLRKGSESELVSNFTRAQFQDLKFKPGIANGSDGQPLASLEVITVINLASADNRRRHQHDGARPAARRHRNAARREAGQRPLVPGRAGANWWWARASAERYPEAQIGQEDPLRPRRLGYRRHHGCRPRRAGQRDLGRPEPGAAPTSSASKCSVRRWCAPPMP